MWVIADISFTLLYLGSILKMVLFQYVLEWSFQGRVTKSKYLSTYLYYSYYTTKTCKRIEVA